MCGTCRNGSSAAYTWSSTRSCATAHAAHFECPHASVITVCSSRPHTAHNIAGRVTATVRENGRTAKHITHSIALALQNSFGWEYCGKGPRSPAKIPG